MAPHSDVELPTGSSAKGAGPVTSPDQPVEAEGRTGTTAETKNDRFYRILTRARIDLSEELTKRGKQRQTMGYDEASVRRYEDDFVAGRMSTLYREIDKKFDGMIKQCDERRRELRRVAGQWRLARRGGFANDVFEGRICSNDRRLKTMAEQCEAVRQKLHNICCEIADKALEQAREARRAAYRQDEAA